MLRRGASAVGKPLLFRCGNRGAQHEFVHAHVPPRPSSGFPSPSSFFCSSCRTPFRPAYNTNGPALKRVRDEGSYMHRSFQSSSSVRAQNETKEQPSPKDTRTYFYWVDELGRLYCIEETTPTNRMPSGRCRLSLPSGQCVVCGLSFAERKHACIPGFFFCHGLVRP